MAFLPRLIAGMMLLTGAGLAQPPAAGRSQTAQQVIDAIVKAYGAAPAPNTVDTIKAGDPTTPVTGVVTTFMDTLAVLRKAVAAGDNLVITHEPTFYNHVDNQKLLGDDPVVAEKLRYIEEHHLVVFRFHDGWHDHQPDGILAGMIEQLGWQAYKRSSADPNIFILPSALSVGELAVTLQRRLGSSAVRVIGDPGMQVTRAALLPGAAGLVTQVTYLQRDDVQVLVAGESAEWEGVEYARDAAAEGRAKALILLGHEPSEEGGMRYLATQLRTLRPDLKVDFIPSGSPFTQVITPASAWTAPADKNAKR